MPQLTGVARLRLSPGEIERLLRDEKERRRKLRITQVRDKAKRLAKSKLEAVKQEKVRQLEILAERIEEEWQVERQNRIQQLEAEYAESLKGIGTAHTQAEELDLGLEQKAIATEENNRRAEERYAAAMRKLNEDRRLQEAEDAKVTQARELAVAKEKIRAREIAHLPPPVKPDLRKLLDRAKAAYVQLTDADTYTYPYQIPADACLVERNDDSMNDGIMGAETEREKGEEYHRQVQCTASERLEKARVRGAHALKRERMRQDYNNMMSELDLLEKADRKHRQQNLEHILQSLFLPAHVVMERETDRQTQMERKVEDMFADDYDHMDLRACAPALNSDTTPTVTETTGLSPSESEPRPPVNRVRDGEPSRERVPLQNVTNITPTTTDTGDTDTGSEKKRKKVLKKILRKIKDQKEQWVNEGEDDLVIPTHQAPDDTAEQEEVEAEQAPAVPAHVTNSSTSDTLSQVPDVSSSQTTDDQISQTRMTSSEGETTTSSQFIERQRQELLEYMKSLESQIGELENLKDDKKALERDETLARRLEEKLAKLKQEHSVETDSSGCDGSKGAELVQSLNDGSASSLTMERQDEGKYQSMRTTSELGIPATTSSVAHLDVPSRRPGESTWEWYLRQKASLGESIRHKLSQITSTERSYELGTPTPHPGGDGVTYSPKEPILQTTTSSLGLHARSDAFPAVRDDQQRGYSLHHDVHDSVGMLSSKTTRRTRFDVPEYDVTPRAELTTKPHPPGYVSVTERELLARRNVPQQQMSPHMESGDMLHGEPFPTASYMQPGVPSLSTVEQEFIPVSERERLMRAPLLRSGEDRSPGKESKQAQKLQEDLAEHSRTLERLQDMMSSTRNEYLPEPSSISTTVVQSQASLPPISQSKPSYMSVDERENLLRTLSQRLIHRDDRAELSRPKWGDVLSTHAAGPDVARVHSTTHGSMWVPPTEAPLLSTQASSLRLHSSSATTTPDVYPSYSVPTVKPQLHTPTAPTVTTQIYPSSSIPTSTSTVMPQVETEGWSAVHQQMLTRQQEFNRRQEELRKQLAEIQEQKRRLLAPSSDQELNETQDSLRRTLQGLGIDLDGEHDTACHSTPGERSTRPPVTAKPGLDDLDLHELSIIQEVDTPTHITTCDESTLLQSLSNANRASASRSTGETGSVTPSVVASDRSERLSKHQQIEEHVSGESTTEEEHGNTNHNAQVTFTGGVNTQSPATTLSTDDERAPTTTALAENGRAPADTLSDPEVLHIPTSDGERLQVLNQLLEQLEERRVQREKFLEQERMTTLREELDEDQPFTSVLDKYKAQRSPPVLDLYSSDSADDIVIPSTAPSTDPTTGQQSLAQRLQEMSKEWIENPVVLPDYKVADLSSSDTASTQSSDKLRQLYTQQLNTGSTSDSASVVGSTPRLYNIEEILQGISSISNSSVDSRDGESKGKPAVNLGKEEVNTSSNVDKNNQSNSSLDRINQSSASLDRSNSHPESKDVSPVAMGRDHGSDSERVNTGSRELSASDDYVSLSQRSDHSSPVSRVAGELTQVTDAALSIGQSEESSVTMKTAQYSASSSIASLDSPVKTMPLDLQLTVDEDSIQVSTPLKFGTGAHQANSSPLKHVGRDESSEQVLGVMEEPEITFASTVGDLSMNIAEEPQPTAPNSKGGGFESPTSSGPGPTAARLHWIEEGADAEVSDAAKPTLTEPPPDVRPKTTIRKDVDSAARKQKKKEAAERTKRLYNRLGEVQERKEYKEREQRKVDVQARRKEYGNQLQHRTKK